MPSENTELLLCYNRGCGSKFDPKNNKEDSCTFHPGNPVFHDAYKSWSCCKKKSTDFTEFLNIKGCTKSFHSDVKPPQPQKPVVDKAKADEVIEYKPPISRISSLARSPFDSPLVTLKPEISSSLKSQMENLVAQNVKPENTSEISIGTTCKNGGCKVTYEGVHSSETQCTYHPGVPVFHEGLKFWSCCKKRTTNFTAFMDQVGCESGTHVWVKEKVDSAQKICRYDWHQTGSHIIVSVYAKKYHPDKSIIQLNPVRAKINLLFPEDGSFFDKDMELYGIVEVDKSQVSMLQTKVEISLKKAEPGNWPKLEIPRQNQPSDSDNNVDKPLARPGDKNSVDLDDIDKK